MIVKDNELKKGELPINKIVLGDCLSVMRKFPSNSISTIICDPPYGLSNHSEKIIRKTLSKWLNGNEEFIPDGKGFMSKDWDAFVPPPALWKEVYRVMKPGATALVFAGTRTQDLMTMSLRLAGLEIKDTLMWIYSQGFPKSLDISKQIDKKAGQYVEGNLLPSSRTTGESQTGIATTFRKKTATNPQTPEAKLWNGWKSHGLKPAYEIVICAEKPLDILGQYAIIVENLLKKEAQLWLLLSAQTVKKLTGLEKNEQKLASIAHWDVWKSTSIKDDLLGQMDMCQLEGTVETILNTVILWRQSLVELYNAGSKSTIKMEIEQIIDWKILNSLLLESTPQSIIKAEIKQPGSWLSASPVAKILNAVVRSINAIQELSAAENVISSQLTNSQGVAGKTLYPNYCPIIMAMKPNEGSYAQNALKWGVAGLNIDGGRIEGKKRSPGFKNP
jgi:hypothetical protein